MAASKTKAAKREDRRRRERAQDLGDGPTFGEALTATGLLAVTSRATRSLIERAEALIRDGARAAERDLLRHLHGHQVVLHAPHDGVAA